MVIEILIVEDITKKLDRNRRSSCDDCDIIIAFLRTELSNMHTYTVFLPNEYDELAIKLAKMAKERDVTISTLIRDALCEHNCFEPARFREIKNVKRRDKKNKKEQDEKK
jgi:hypothetical protein